MKIYTRTGDRGDTGLFGGQRVSKDDVRVEAYGAVDELNSVLGMAARQLEADGEQGLTADLRLVQADLLSLGASLATPAPEDGGRPTDYIPELPVDRIAEMERWMDAAETELEPLRVFILPGGTEAAARLHVARTICRRAERRVVTLAHQVHVDIAVVQYLNRLSDLLFTYARLANQRAGGGDVKWERGR